MDSVGTHRQRQNKIGRFSSVQCFYCSGKNGIHMHAPAMKYKLGNFSGSVWKLNALVFAFKTGIVEYKDGLQYSG